MQSAVSFDYFYGGESELFSYYRIPRLLVTGEQFKNLSTDAKLLYGLLLDRMSLSAKNGWFDDTPTYYWGLPSIVVDFIEKLTLDGDVGYCYHVATYGTTTGQSSRQMRELLCAKHIPMDAAFSVKMVDTWTPTFDLSDPEKNRRITKNAAIEAQEVAAQIAAKKHGDFAKAKVPMPLVRWYYAGYGKKAQTEKFALLDSCIGCGVCAKQCPADAIQIRDKRAVWVKEQCVMCLGCLHHCPKFAIQYGPNTQKHGQFVNDWKE